MGADEATVRKHTVMKNLELLLEPWRRGKGVVLMISHIGNWELFAQATFYAKGVPFGTVFQKVHNPLVNARIDQMRQRLGVRTFDRSRGLGAAAQFLKEGGVLGVLVDQHAGDSGIWTPFFGRLASTSPLAATLALRAGAAVVPCAIQTNGWARWSIRVKPEIPTANHTVESLTAAVNHQLEEQIRESPADWFWVHNRWKLPKPDFLLNRAKRGVFLPSGATPDDLKPLRVAVRSSNWLGDAVMSIPAVRLLREGRPDLRVTILSPAKLAELWRRVPGVDEVIELPANRSLWESVRRIKRGHFAAALLWPNSLRSALEVWLAGVPRRIGYVGHHRKKLLNCILPRRPQREGRGHHQSLDYLRAIHRLGGPDPTSVAVEDLLGPARPMPSGPIRLGLCPGAEYGPAKRWPIEQFKQAMETISAQAEVTWQIFGVEKDRPLAAQLVEGFSGEIEDLTGRTTLGELMDALQGVRALLTNDTGTMHLAAFLGVPVVAIFGSTEPRLTGPMGRGHVILREQVECAPCYLRECPLDFRCMKAITPERVSAEILARLK
jgi:ADP-heptose:LPS heptosyltransferase